MTIPIYANEIHKIVIEDYRVLLDTFVHDLATESQLAEYVETTKTIVDYHNGFDGDIYTWLMIMPLHLSVMTSGLFIGLENDTNRATIRGYKLILDNHLYALTEVLSSLDIKKDE
tara:strand:- start:2723 stop:3067 length:345 start_codon:yes stop_codon:yes gene_type:complete